MITCFVLQDVFFSVLASIIFGVYCYSCIVHIRLDLILRRLFIRFQRDKRCVHAITFRRDGGTDKESRR